MAENRETPISLDSLLPPDVATKVEDIGVKKGNLDFLSMFMLAILAGAFIGFGAIFCTTAMTGISDKVGFGITKLVGGLVFSLGLILVIVAGAELFTGNNLLIMAAASRKLSFSKLVWNWIILYIGNFVGSILTAFIMFLTLQYMMSSGGVGVTALNIADAKCGLDFIPALTRGIYCNTLVCLAVWLTFSCRTSGDKILAIIFPITAFVACGFEHSVANMYFISIGLFIKHLAPMSYWTMIGQNAADFSNLTGFNFIRNLVPVTIGNMIGGGAFVGVIYWVVYLRKKNR
ncbi:MAG TPA: formate/nitrite transporter family protein [Sedimentisphaerales bacterium]|nr:formate/nitrite transporter family protein [Sedimentisphaerales bacterium]